MFAAVMISLITFASADQDLVVLLVGVPAALLAWFVTSAGGPRAAPRYVINILLFLVVSWGSLTVFAEGLGVSLFSEFVAALMIIKLLDRRSSRDSAQILTLAVFLMLGAILTSNSMWVGLLMILFLPVIVSAVLWHQLARVEEKAATPPSGFTTARAPTKRRALLVPVAAFAIGTVIFMLMPREIGSDAFGSWGSASAGRIVGFNDEVKLGTGGLISKSQSPVIDIEISNRAGESIGNVGRRFYLRGAVLDTYDRASGSWVRSSDPRNAYQPGPSPMIRPRMTAVGGEQPAAWTTRLEVTIRNITGERGHLFSIWRPYRARVHPPAQLGFCTWDGALRVRGDNGKVSYTLECNNQEPPPTTWAEYSDDERRNATLDLPGVAAVARRLLRDAGIEPDPLKRPAADDLPAVSILRNYFDTGGFRYTLDTIAAPAGRDPIEWFLVDGRKGHCEYYASSLAAMCRTVGINARVITGYVATDYNTATASYIVRASNAHAWIEAEVLPGYWRSFDPTPSVDQTRLHEPPRGMMADIHRMIDTVEFAWIRTVVSYDADTRTKLFGRAGASASIFPILERIGAAVDDTQDSPKTLILIAARNALVTFFAVLLLGVGLLRWGGRLWRRIADMLSLLAGQLVPSWSRPPVSPAQTLRSELLGLYRLAGVEKPAWRPLRTHTRDLGRSGMLPVGVERAATNVTDLLYAALFRECPPPDDQIRSARRDLDVIRAWIKQRGRQRRRRPEGDPPIGRDE